MIRINNNYQLEQYVLTCMIIHTECSKEIGLLEEIDFTLEVHKQIYRGIKDLVKENKKFDEMILIQHLNNSISSHDLVFVAETLALKSHFKEYIKELKGLTLKRKLQDISESILKSESTGEEIIEEVEREIFKLSENMQTEDFTEVKDVISDVLEDIEKQQRIKGYTGLETGFKKLDEITNGFQDSDYILLGARPSMGKTAFALNIIKNAAMRGNKVAFFSLEMSKKQVIKRMILSESFVNDEKIKAKQLNDKDYIRLTATGSKLYKTNIFINDSPSLTVARMKSMCRKVKRKNGLQLVVIDYLQLIKSKEGSGRREKVEAVSRDLKAMAKELQVPLLVISSLSRANEGRKEKQPILSDIRETGQIEFDADLIMFLHREYYYDPLANPNIADLIIAKQRNGGLGVIKLGWIGGCTKFLNYDELEQYREVN